MTNSSNENDNNWSRNYTQMETGIFRTMNGKKRTALFQQYGLEYLGFDTRISFYTRGRLDTIQKNNHFASGYFCHYVLPERLVFEHLECIQEPYAD